MGLQRSPRVSSRMMFRVSLLLPLLAAASAAPEARFLCSECVREMHGLAAMVKMGAIPIHDYIRDNYCPTLDSTAAQHFCEDSLSKYYVGMLFAVVEHWFVDGALSCLPDCWHLRRQRVHLRRVHPGPGVGGGLPGRPHHDRGVQDLPGAKLLPERLGRLQAAGGGALHACTPWP